MDELLTAAGRTTRPAGPAQLLGRAAIRFAMAWLTLTLIAQQARDAAEGRFQHPLEAAASEVGARIDRWRLLVSLERRRPAAGYAELKEEAARLFEAVRRKEELEAWEIRALDTERRAVVYQAERKSGGAVQVTAQATADDRIWLTLWLDVPAGEGPLRRWASGWRRWTAAAARVPYRAARADVGVSALLAGSVDPPDLLERLGNALESSRWSMYALPSQAWRVEGRSPKMPDLRRRGLLENVTVELRPLDGAWRLEAASAGHGRFGRPLTLHTTTPAGQTGGVGRR